jgi:hypothetical protein
MTSIVYQYTDATAFNGVVENKVIWATDYRYLNDAQELVYTWRAFIERLERLANESGEYSEAYRAQLEALSRMNAADLMKFDDAMFVACFTERPDALSQWISYGANGYGFALGFDSDRITMLKIPQYNHGPRGQLVTETAILSGTDERIPFEWGAYLQKVGYGEPARDRIVDHLIYMTEQRCGTNDLDSFDWKVGSCIMQQHALLHQLPLVKHPDFEHEQEHRITITEHHGGRSLSQLRALGTVGKPWSDFAQGKLTTVNVKFRQGGSAIFTPYTELPFDPDALVEVVIGPKAKHRLVEPTVRRMLDRHGFRHTKITTSQSSFQ